MIGIYLTCASAVSRLCHSSRKTATCLHAHSHCCGCTRHTGRKNDLTYFFVHQLTLKEELHSAEAAGQAAAAVCASLICTTTLGHMKKDSSQRRYSILDMQYLVVTIVKDSPSTSKFFQSSAIMYNQGRNSNQCHRAMAWFDILPCPESQYVYWAPRKKDPLNPRSGTGCFYPRSAPMCIIHVLYEKKFNVCILYVTCYTYQLLQQVAVFLLL